MNFFFRQFCSPQKLLAKTFKRGFATEARIIEAALGDSPTSNTSWTQANMSWGSRYIKIQNGDKLIVLPNLWLRDNCRCTKCVNQDTMQRAFDTFSIPEDIEPSKVKPEYGGLHVNWDHDKHESFYPWRFLLKHRARPNGADYTNEPYIYWGAEIKSRPPSVRYGEIMAGDSGVGILTQNIRKYGFCYIDDCPVDPEETKVILERIAFIRVTHYGGFYDFTSDLTMKDTAYTSLALGAHTDTAYFTDPAGLQMFHLLSHTDGTGGESLLVDGFKAALTLRDESPESYSILSKKPITWHASGNKGITITPAKKFPVLERNPNQGDNPPLLQVRWNNDDRGVVGLDQEETFDAQAWYSAAKRFNDILKRKDMEYWQQLIPGRPLIFDNWRVLHGRSAFTGKRRICGGYINHDDYISRWRNTNFSRKEVFSQIL